MIDELDNLVISNSFLKASQP